MAFRSLRRCLRVSWLWDHPICHCMHSLKRTAFDVETSKSIGAQLRHQSDDRDLTVSPVYLSSIAMNCVATIHSGVAHSASLAAIDRAWTWNLRGIPLPLMLSKLACLGHRGLATTQRVQYQPNSQHSYPSVLPVNESFKIRENMDEWCRIVPAISDEERPCDRFSKRFDRET